MQDELGQFPKKKNMAREELRYAALCLAFQYAELYHISSKRLAQIANEFHHYIVSGKPLNVEPTPKRKI